MAEAERVILHVDMDAFFASVAQLDDPTLRGRPVLVGGSGNRGVVSTASYEARKFGCRSAMPMAVARRLCPQAVVVKANGARLREINGQIHDIFARFTPLVQPVSIDEAFLDCSGTGRLFGDGRAIGTEIRRLILAETKLTASVGVSYNKFLAKLASDLDKPDALTVINPDTLDVILPPLSVGRIWGIGPKSVLRLERMGVKTIGDLRQQTPDFCQRLLGTWGTRVRELALGMDDRPVHPDRDAKSVGQEETFGLDRTSPQSLRDTLLEQAELIGMRLRRYRRYAGCVTVKIRFGNFQTITRRCTLTNPTDRTSDFHQAACGLFDAWAKQGFAPVRLIGMSVSSLSSTAQLGLFDHATCERQRGVDVAMDRIRDRFGRAAIGRGAAGTGPGRAAGQGAGAGETARKGPERI